MINKIVKSVGAFCRLCILRGSPSDLPFSWPLLGGVILACVADVFFVQRKGSVSLAGLITTELFAVSILVGLIYLILWQRKQLNRFHKTLLAWFGTEIIFNIIGRLSFGQVDLAATQNPGILIFSVWFLLVKSYILKNALGVSLAMAFLILMGMFIVLFLVMSAILTPLQ